MTVVGRQQKITKGWMSYKSILYYLSQLYVLGAELQILCKYCPPQWSWT